MRGKRARLPPPHVLIADKDGPPISDLFEKMRCSALTILTTINIIQRKTTYLIASGLIN